MIPTSTRWRIVTLACVAALLVFALFWARKRRASRKDDNRAGELVLHVPRATSPIVIDGETSDRAWLDSPGPARTGAFRFPNGELARPYSDARIFWSDEFLYLALYAADEDIETRTDQTDGPLWLDDYFRVRLQANGAEYVIDVSPKGVVSDARGKPGGGYDYGWSSGVRVGHDTDGTINDPKDMDEEWVIELAIPLASIGVKGQRGERIGFSLHRCDTPKGSARVCSGWGEGPARGALVFD